MWRSAKKCNVWRHKNRSIIHLIFRGFLSHFSSNPSFLDVFLSNYIIQGFKCDYNYSCASKIKNSLAKITRKVTHLNGGDGESLIFESLSEFSVLPSDPRRNDAALLISPRPPPAASSLPPPHSLIRISFSSCFLRCDGCNVVVPVDSSASAELLVEGVAGNSDLFAFTKSVLDNKGIYNKLLT